VNTQASGTGSIAIGGVSVAPGDIATVAGNYATCATSTAACGDGSSAAQASFNSPTAVYLDSSGNIYVLDSNDNRVRVVNPQTSNAVNIAGVSIGAGDIATIAGTGTAGYTGDGSIATKADLFYPSGVYVVDTDIFIADQVNSVVRAVNTQSGDIQTAVGTGVYGFSGDGGAPLNAELALPVAVRGDSSGDLFISDGVASRIRKAGGLLASPPTATLSAQGVQFAAQALETTSAAQTVTISNRAYTTNLVVSTVAISGTNASDFKQTNNCTTVPAGASCTITITFAPTATGSRTATLSVTDNAAGSPQTVVLNGAAVLPFGLPDTGTLSPSSVSPGGSAAATITVTWEGTSSALVALSCSVSPSPANAPTCSLSPSSLAPKNGTANSTLTVGTVGASAALKPGVLPRSRIMVAIWLFLPAMVLCTAGMRASKKRNALGCLLLAFAIAGGMLLVACGGSPSTPAQKYVVTVTAASSGVPTQTEQLQLTVQ